MATLKLSVIIPTYNRASQLTLCLDALTKQDYKERFELVVVDDGSRDNTKEVVGDFFKKNKKKIQVSYLYQKNQGCAVARNTGIRHAQGEYLFFTDDDCIVPKNWITRILEGFKKYPDASAVGGWYEVDEEVLNNNKYLRAINNSERTAFEDYENYEFISSFGAQKNPCGNTANVCYKKEVFKKIGYFDTWTRKTARIDWEFKLRAHYSGLYLLYIPLIVRHNKIMTFSGFINNAFRYGQADWYLDTRFKWHYSSVDFSSLLGNLGNIRNKFPNESLLYNFIFLYCNLLGAKYARILKKKSVLVFSQVNKYVVTYEKENIYTKKKEFCKYLQGTYYQVSNDSIKRRYISIELLEKEYKTPLISVLIPFYNRSEYVNDLLIENINNLTCSDSALELIFIDDGSTDNTLEVLEESISKFRFKTRVLTKPNGGPASARNLGIRNAKGGYIFMTDSDTAVPKYWLREFLSAFLLDPEIVLVGGSGQINKKPRTIFDSYRNYAQIKDSLAFITNSSFKEKNLPYDTACMAIKNTSDIFFDEHVPDMEDFDLVYSLKKEGRKVCHIPFVVSNLRSMDKKDFTHTVNMRAKGYKAFVAKYQDYRYYVNVYTILSSLFRKMGASSKFRTLRLLSEIRRLNP